MLRLSSTFRYVKWWRVPIECSNIGNMFPRALFVRSMSSKSAAIREQIGKDQNVDELEKIVKLVESLLQDNTGMKKMKLPRSFPYTEDTEDIKQLIVGNNSRQPFNFLKHVLHLKPYKPETELLEELTTLLNNSQKSQGFQSLIKFLSGCNRAQLQFLKYGLLCTCVDDLSYFDDKILPIFQVWQGDNSNCPEFKEVFDPISFYEFVVSLSIYRGDHKSAIFYHSRLFAIIRNNNLKVNWLPIILSAILSQTSEALDTLMKIHFTVDLRNDGFFEYIIPFFVRKCKTTADVTNLVKWTSVLVKLGDIPSKSDPYFTKIFEVLLQNGFGKSALYIFYELKNNNFSTIDKGLWASNAFIHVIIKCVNLNQVKDKLQFIDQLVTTFKSYDYLHDPSFWYALIQEVQFPNNDVLNKVLNLVNLLMAKFDVRDNYDLYCLKCIKSKENSLFLTNFDSLINYHDSLQQEGEKRVIPAKILGIFLKILASYIPEAAEECDDEHAIQRIEDSFEMLKQYILVAQKSLPIDKSSFFSLCYELPKGFLVGLTLNSTVSKFQKLDYLSRLETFIYDTLLVNSISLDVHNQRLLLKLEIEIIKFRLSARQLKEGLSRMERLITNIKKLNGKGTTFYKIDPYLASHAVGILSNDIIENLKSVGKLTYDTEVVESYNNSNILTLLKVFIQIHQLDPDCISVSSWTHLLICTARIRPFEELEYFAWWLIKMVNTQQRDIKVKVTHSSHPLNQLFSQATISRLMKLAFTKVDQSSSYQPWRTLELILKVSDITGLYLDNKKIQKEIKWGLKLLYIDDYSSLSPEMKAARLANQIDSLEMIHMLNEIWKTSYDQPIDISLGDGEDLIERR